MNIAWNAVTKLNNPDRGYEEGFLTQLAECLDVILSNRIKVVANAGALNTPSLGRKAQDLCQDRGSQDLVVATVIGDDISELLQRRGPELQCLWTRDCGRGSVVVQRGAKRMGSACWIVGCWT